MHAAIRRFCSTKQLTEARGEQKAFDEGASGIVQPTSLAGAGTGSYQSRLRGVLVDVIPPAVQ